MLDIAGAFFLVVIVIFGLSILLRTSATPDIFGGLREGFRGFRDGMKKP